MNESEEQLILNNSTLLNQSPSKGSHTPSVQWRKCASSRQLQLQANQLEDDLNQLKKRQVPTERGTELPNALIGSVSSLGYDSLSDSSSSDPKSSESCSLASKESTEEKHIDLKIGTHSSSA